MIEKLLVWIVELCLTAIYYINKLNGQISINFKAYNHSIEFIDSDRRYNPSFKTNKGILYYKHSGYRISLYKKPTNKRLLHSDHQWMIIYLLRIKYQGNLIEMDLLLRKVKVISGNIVKNRESLTGKSVKIRLQYWAYHKIS